MAIAKVAVAAVAVVGVTTATTIALVSSTGIPEWRPLSEDDTGTYTGKYAANRERYFVGVTDKAKEGSKYSSIDYKVWWEWSFKNKYTGSNPTDAFAGKSKWEELRDACKASYLGSATATGGEITGENNDNKKYKEEQVWKYCSPLGKKPTTIGGRNEENDYKDKAGHDTTNKTKLVSVKDSENDTFWRLKQKYFFADAEPTDANEAYFQEFHKKNKAANRDLALKDECGKLYSKEADASKSTTEKPKKEEVLKYCSLEGQ